MTITEFLLARIAEDESSARACAEVYPSPWDVNDRGHSALVRADEPNFPVVAEIDQSQVTVGWPGDRLRHLARHDPARVLRECAAKRRIITLHELTACVAHVRVVGSAAGYEDQIVGHLCAICNDPEYDSGREPACATLLALASAYADHPDYDEAWR